ncbi:MAG: hypothetical protein U0792_13345 [Gemmataceae bacterium]
MSKVKSARRDEIRGMERLGFGFSQKSLVLAKGNDWRDAVLYRGSFTSEPSDEQLFAVGKPVARDAFPAYGQRHDVSTACESKPFAIS